MNAKALNISTTVTIWFVVVITIWSEMSKPLKGLLKSVTGHHWVTKGVFSIVVFAVVYMALMKIVSDSENTSSIYTVIASAIAGGLAILVFYIWHFLLA